MKVKIKKKLDAEKKILVMFGYIPQDDVISDNSRLQVLGGENTYLGG